MVEVLLLPGFFPQAAETTTRLKVTSCKRHFPNLGLAQDFFTKIADQAK